ncbi:MAG: hypothetical protein MSA26_09755 [Lachnospiraceae bacterium]|nr:hypothetical protein [Lachnospiraceae bacterium]
MITLRGVAVTDQVNRYGEKLDFKGLINAYSDAWKNGFPVSLNHDHTKCVGWSQLKGIYMEPGIAYQTNGIWIPENDTEYKIIKKHVYNYQYEQNYLNKKKYYEELKQKLGSCISNDYKWLWADAITILDSGMVFRVFPEIKETMKDGLIPLKELEPISPGVYKRDEFLIFAHHYFRRNLSRLNTLNVPFLSRLEKLKDEDLEIQVAIDPDMIGLADTQVEKREYQYWWGPSFNEDLTLIPLGVTRHENENYNELMSNIRQTEFYWHMQGGKQTLECEELTDIPNVEDDYGCRYIHSMINPENGLPDHLDGAIRAYDDEKLLNRFEISLDHAPKNTKYFKLWRIDKPISVKLWKELISHYFRDNRLVGEYFGGVDKNDQKDLVVEKKKDNTYTPLKEYIPCDITAENGIRATVQFHDKFTMNEERDVTLRISDFFFIPGRKEKYYEAETLTFIKLLKREGVNVRVPYTTRIAYEDLIFNMPIFMCKSVESAEIVQNCILKLCKAWNRWTPDSDRLLSYSIQINYMDKSVLLSFAGNTVDIEKVMSVLGTKLPEEQELPQWCDRLRNCINSYGKVNGQPKLTDLMRSDGTLHFERKMVPPEMIEKTDCGHKDVYATLKLKEEEYNIINNNNIQIAPMYKIKNSKCNKCGKPYFQCDCIKFIDDDVTEEIIDFEWLAMSWTLHHA